MRGKKAPQIRQRRLRLASLQQAPARLSAIVSSRNDLAQGNERGVPHPNYPARTPIQTAISDKARQTALRLVA
jgi:hypothetical protein